ncbi:tyrosine-type recombinase/integrase [Enterococcus avium]|uniref:tyrosine-type recombinase/integrase n=1 Tax=Enterococcus avium TaxID=33945 RepID=UPI00270A9285|nr:site-specific integrase [Enterococcus avium]MDO7798986.1 site-specific integrase [Enterococcus avium]
MAKKGENIYKRKDGRWEARYSKGRRANGKIIYGSVYGRSYAEVKQKSNIMKGKYATHMEKTINPYTGDLGEWLHFWLKKRLQGQIKETTYSNYIRMSKKHILPELGAIQLVKLHRKDVTTFILNLQKKNLSAGSINNIFTLLKKCLDEAKKQGYILENCCEKVTIPQKKRKEVRVLTISQQKKLEFQAFHEETCSPTLLSLYSGLRIGEISGLKWEDIDFENDLIHVRRTVSRIVNEIPGGPRTKLIEGTPKSSNSFRVVPLSTNLKNYLKDKKNSSSSSYVVSNTPKMMEPRTISNRFNKLITAANIPVINFHVLRHTFATRCMEKGMDVASLSRILGHQSTKMTLDTYTGSLMETRRKGMAELDKLFKFTNKPSEILVKHSQ